jgi:hypothetical protein
MLCTIYSVLLKKTEQLIAQYVHVMLRLEAMEKFEGMPSIDPDISAAFITR